MQLALAVQQQIGGAERVADGEAERGALRQANLGRVEREAQIRARRPRTLAAVAPGEITELAAEAFPGLGGPFSQQLVHRGRDFRFGAGRIEHECTVVGIPVAVDVAGDGRRERVAAREPAKPVHAQEVEEVVAHAVRDLVTRVECAARPFNIQRIANGAGEAAHLLAVVGKHIRRRPREVAAEVRGRERHANLLALAAKIGAQLAHACELLAHARIARRDGASGRDDARLVHEHRTPVLVGEREARGGQEIEVDEAALVEVHAVRAFHREAEPVVEDRPVPLEIATHAGALLEVLAEQRDVRRVAGEHGAGAAVGAGGGNAVWIGRVQVPLRKRGCRADAVQLLHTTREARVVDRRPEQRGAGYVLEHADAPAHHGAWAAYGAVERGDLRRFANRLREAEARAEVDAVGRVVVSHLELALDFRIESRRRGEAIAVDAQSVLELQVRIHAIGISERYGTDRLAGALEARRELARVIRRTVCLEIGERIEVEGAARIRGLILLVAVLTDFARELEAVLVVLAEPRQLVQHAATEIGAPRAQVRVTAEADVANTARAICERGVDEHTAVWQQRVRRAVIAVRVEVEARFAQEQVLDVRGVVSLEPATVIRAIAAVRRQLGRELAHRRLLVPVAVEREVERLARRGARRREVDASEQRALILEAIVRDAAADGRRNPCLLRERDEPRDGIRRDARGLEADGIRVEQRLEIVRATTQLIRNAVVQLVHHDGPRHGSAERHVAVLLAERTRGAIGPLHLG